MRVIFAVDHRGPGCVRSGRTKWLRGLLGPGPSSSRHVAHTKVYTRHVWRAKHSGKKTSLNRKKTSIKPRFNKDIPQPPYMPFGRRTGSKSGCRGDSGRFSGPVGAMPGAAEGNSGHSQGEWRCGRRGGCPRRGSQPQAPGPADSFSVLGPLWTKKTHPRGGLEARPGTCV